MSTKRRAAEMREDAEVQHSIAEMMVANTFDHVLSKAEAIAEAESLLHGGDDSYENPFGVQEGCVNSCVSFRLVQRRRGTELFFPLL